MIKLYFWPTPNGYKISILLEELALPYEVEAIHIGKGEQFAEGFLKVSPNNKIPAIVDLQGPAGKPFALFESAAIMMYLAEKAGFRFMPSEMSGRYEVVQWLTFQAASMGPMLGQAHHFREYTKEKVPYAIERFTSEARRLYRVLEKRLSETEYLAGDYSIADMATYPWLRSHAFQGQTLEEFPSIQRWYSAVRARPAVRRGLAVLKQRFEKNKKPPAGDAWENLFGNRQFMARTQRHQMTRHQTKRLGEHLVKKIEFYWDLGSTNSYFALHLIKPLAKKHSAELVPHPFNLGYVFRKQSYVLMEEPKAKLRARKADLMRWAKRYDLPFSMPTKFPMKTSPALRGALVMRRFGREWDFMERIFASYWQRNDASVGELSGLKPIAGELGVDQDEFERLVESEDIRSELAAETDRGLERGVFGVPTFFVGDEMFWGKDRMEFIDDELTSPSPPRNRRAQPHVAG